MRRPAPAPSDGPDSAVWESPADFLRAFADHEDTDPRYLAWDDFRFRREPGALTVEQQWSLVRFRRRSTARALPQLVDEHGHAFSYVLADEVLQLIDHIRGAASGEITIADEVTHTGSRNRYIVSSLIEEAITSSQLEGAATSRMVAKEMLTSGRSPRTRDERMIVNNFRAMQQVREWRSDDITPDRIRELHRIVTDGTLDDPAAAGRLQVPDEDRVAVWSPQGELLHSPPPATQLPERLERLCQFANGPRPGEPYLPPLLRAVAVHFMTGHDHYFEDGNGRTARALFYWVMLREGFWLTEYLSISRLLKAAPSQYARSYLLTETDDGDLTHFFIYNLGTVRRAIEALHEHLARKSAELRKVKAAMDARHGEFNHRQLTALEHALRNPSAVFTVHSHATTHHVSGESARKDLADLAHRGYFVQRRSSKHNEWRPTPDLADQLGAPTA
ncbi:Fic family protein [Pimelobacter simplex]|uniref:Uncharacterized protein n=1 Tax=Nocardioides simplex TaxID=2045 RepID=A0A0A1DTA3_NOCSI|nr:Fic family protein [Pimelobacter simplex]AIY19852.1 hypothetical protein KR76_10510 [Pimelobacter simplex]MCG8151790.1 Fic family protein [Pimelobacter simplex]GEB13034.1 Fic family protein [Pimelobacter simplex]